MPLSNKLDRKLQAADESSDGEDYYEVTDRSSSESMLETGDGGEVISSGGEDGEGAQDEAMVSTLLIFILYCPV
jgi:ribosomal RNA-processing protein 36